MEYKFQNSLTKGDFGNGFALRQALLDGDFWPRVSGCLAVYRGQDGNIDYDNVVAAPGIADSQVVVTGQDLPPETIWHYVCRQVAGCGLESPDGRKLAVVIVDSTGDGLLPAPNAPTGLTATLIAAGSVRLRWRYSPVGQAAEPTGFKVYIDSGSGFDFDTPTATVNVQPQVGKFGGTNISWDSDALVHGQLYKFCVRSYKTAQGESQNHNYVFAIADDTGPAAIDDLIASWETI